jgi:phage terminase large subunit
MVRKVTYADNPWFPEVLRKEMEYDRAHDTDKYLHVWEGEPRKASKAQVFAGKWRIGETPDKSEVYYYGADWGFSQDPTVLVRCFILDQVLYIDHEAYGVGVDIDMTPQMFDRVPGARDWYITADSARPETISYMAKNGWKIRGAKKGKGSVEDGVAFLRSFKEIVVNPRCRHTIDEMRLYSYKVDRLTGDVLPALAAGNEHIFDAVRYSLGPIIRSRKGAMWLQDEPETVVTPLDALRAKLAAVTPEGSCGTCSAYRDGVCDERGLTVGERDPGCGLWVGRE